MQVYFINKEQTNRETSHGWNWTLLFLSLLMFIGEGCKLPCIPSPSMGRWSSTMMNQMKHSSGYVLELAQVYKLPWSAYVTNQVFSFFNLLDAFCFTDIKNQRHMWVCVLAGVHLFICLLMSIEIIIGFSTYHNFFGCLMQVITWFSWSLFSSL